MVASVWFAAPRQVELRDEVLPALGATDVRVEATVSALSQGTEMLVFRGEVPDGLELDLPTLRGSFAFPIKYGYASVGRVVEAGASTGRLHVGDVVFSHHPHQTAYVVPEEFPVALPPDVEPEAGVFLANVESAANIVLDAAPRIGERVVVFGQGVVGLLITQLLRRTGVSDITVVEPIDARRALACQIGADEALADGKSAEGAEFDVAIEASGHPSALDQALRCVAFGGTVVVCSWYGTKPVALQLGGPFHRRRLRIISSQVSTIDAAIQPRWTHRRRLELARGLLGKLELRPLVSHRFPLEHAGEAYRLVDERPDQTVQVLLTYTT